MICQWKTLCVKAFAPYQTAFFRKFANLSFLILSLVSDHHKQTKNRKVKRKRPMKTKQTVNTRHVI